MKRLYRMFLIGMVVLLCVPIPLSASETGLAHFSKTHSYTGDTFQDVAESDWFYNNVKAVYELRLMVGKEKSVFDTASTMTLAETVTIAARLHSIYTTGKNDFSASDPWYQTYVDYAKDNGIADLTGKSMVELTNRAQFAEILANAFPAEALQVINAVEENAIPDVSLDESYGEAVYRLYRAGILTGSDKYGAFAPSSYITRAEVAAIVTRMVEPSLRKTVSLQKPKDVVIASGTAQAKPQYGFTLSEGKGLQWTLTANGVLTITGRGDMGRYEVSIKNEISENGTIVKTPIDTRPWGEYADRIKIVNIADGCTSIGYHAFYKCKNLVEVNIPESVTSIGPYGFAFCEKIENVKLPSKLVYLTEGAFYGCESLQSIELPDTIERMYFSLFTKCINLQSVKMPAGLKVLQSDSFDCCRKIKEIVFPASLEQVFAHALLNTAVKALYFYGDAPEFVPFAGATTPFYNTVVSDGKTYGVTIDQQPTIYYIEGKKGWTSPTWTAPDGTVYNSATFDPDNME